MAVTYSNQGAQPSWMKTGAAAQSAYKQAVHQAQVAKEAAEKMRTFYLNEGEEKTGIFLDGVLDGDGILTPPLAYNEHNCQTGPKSWSQLICVSDSEICPLCNSGNQARFTSVFTFLNLTPYTIQKGPNQGKVLGPRRELYKAGISTLRLLQTYSTKWGGLAGKKVEITRVTDKDPRAGNLFQKLEVLSHSEIVAAYSAELATPANYAEELTYMTAEQMAAAGFGVAPTGPGFNKPSAGAQIGNAADQM